MKKKVLIILLIQISLIRFETRGETDATIPAYHWAYSYISRLRLRGYLEQLNMIQQPFTEGAVVNCLIDLQNKIQQCAIKPTNQHLWLIDLLAKEFLYKSNLKADSTKLLIIQPGIWADELIINEGNETKFYTQLRSQLGFKLGKNLYFYNGMLLDQSLLDDSLYAGKKWRGFAAYTEQAYIRFTNDDHARGRCAEAHSGLTNFESRIPNYEFRLTVGRDFINWGSGKTGRLLFSDHAQPLDQISVNLKYKGLQFTTIAADLDHWLLSDSSAKHYRAPTANRFLSAHRLTLNFKNKLYLGLTEALLYGGPHSNWELKYHNPLLYYHGELLNGGGSDGNGFLYLDFDWYPWKDWEFYGEILVDDFQLEKTSSGDMEPNEIGLLFGTQHSDIFGLDGSLVGIEYVRIANRTYNSSFEWEKLVHFNRPIGYHLGNNFDRWHLTMSYYPIRGLQAGMDFDYIRNGDGSILDPWDTPWSNYSLSEGYDEPFPYGIVETTSNITLNLRYHFRANVMIENQISYRSLANADNQPGKSKNNWTLFFKFHWDIGGTWYY